MHHTAKPAHKCHGCKLNLGDHCGVFPEPHLQWEHGTCKGFNNEEMVRKYLEDVAKHPPDPKKEKRREQAKIARTQRPSSFIPKNRIS